MTQAYLLFTTIHGLSLLLHIMKRVTLFLKYIIKKYFFHRSAYIINTRIAIDGDKYDNLNNIETCLSKSIVISII